MGEKKTLSVLFRGWLKQCIGKKKLKVDLDALMERLKYVRTGGRKFTREEMNERR